MDRDILRAVGVGGADRKNACRDKLGREKSMCIHIIHAIRIRFLNAPVPFCMEVARGSYRAPGTVGRCVLSGLLLTG